jgi:glycerate-2-kinase
MSIHEINIIRKHVSQIKGGRLARLIPSQSFSLILSDVIGDEVESIASGPMSPDSSTFSDVLSVLKNYKLGQNSIPANIWKIIVKGSDGEIEETPKKDNPIFSRVNNFVIGSNSIARKAISSKAESLGVETIDSESFVDEEAIVVGKNLAKIALQYLKDYSRPLLYISGGEPIVKVRGDGIGGRNQEVIGSFLREISLDKDYPDLSLIAFGTDGIDGNSKYAGAICDIFTLKRLREKRLEIGKYQNNNNMTGFFQKLGASLILTGPTGTNVMDIHLLLVNTSQLM